MNRGESATGNLNRSFASTTTSQTSTTLGPLFHLNKIWTRGCTIISWNFRCGWLQFQNKWYRPTILLLAQPQFLLFSHRRNHLVPNWVWFRQVLRYYYDPRLFMCVYSTRRSSSLRRTLQGEFRENAIIFLPLPLVLIVSDEALACWTDLVVFH